jgi:hypothetical protein
MKIQKTIFLLLLASAVKLSIAQTINITGTVQTKQGDPIHFAFVQDKQFKNAAYTDSLGNFSLAVNANSRLFVNCEGFRDTLIDIKNQTSFSIILQVKNIPMGDQGVAAPVNQNSNINMATFRDELQLNEPGVSGSTMSGGVVPGKPGTPGTSVTVGAPMVDAAQGAIFPVFHHKDDTQGSRYLFPSWVHGYVVNNKDSIVQNPIFLFDYDKIGGNLLLTKDKHAAIEIYRDLIKSFTLVDALNQQYTFTMVPDIDKTHFVQVIASGSNYKIYKLTKTKFVASNYSSDGLASTGNNYDEYQDEGTYYVLDAKTNQLQKLPSLRKKTIKEVFAKEPDKLSKFMADNSDSSIDDSYLANLGDYMNK